MPRIARVVAESIPHHVIQRGNRNQTVFFSDEDKTAYLELLKTQIQKHQVRIWAWCLMDNHVHFVAVPSRQDSFSRAFAETHRLYSRRINFREGWRGYLFQGRFSSFPMDERHLYAAVRYVENNPVKAKVGESAEDYPWSSARSHVLHIPDGILSPCFLQDEILNWSKYLRGASNKEEELLSAHLRTGRPLGDASFIEKLEAALGRKLRKQKPGPKAGKFASAVN